MEQLRLYLRNAPSISAFKQNILKFIRVAPNKIEFESWIESFTCS